MAGLSGRRGEQGGWAGLAVRLYPRLVFLNKKTASLSPGGLLSSRKVGRQISPLPLLPLHMRSGPSWN